MALVPAVALVLAARSVLEVLQHPIPSADRPAPHAAHGFLLYHPRSSLTLRRGVTVAGNGSERVGSRRSAARARVPGDDERHHEQAEPRPQKAGHATFRAAVERPLDFPRAVLHFLDATTPRFAQRAKRSPCSPSTIRTCLLCPAMRTPILARGREPTARGRCHLSRPRGSRTRSVSGSATHPTPAARAVNRAQLPDAAGGRRRWSRCPPSSFPFSTAPPRGDCRPRRLRHLGGAHASPGRFPSTPTPTSRSDPPGLPSEVGHPAFGSSCTGGFPAYALDGFGYDVPMFGGWDTGEVEQRTVPRCPWSRCASGPGRKALAHVFHQCPTTEP